jgi:hypothetical protein
MCFSCCLDPGLQTEISTAKDDIRLIKLSLVNHLKHYTRMTPLEIMAEGMQAYEISDELARELYAAYEEFLKILSSREQRDHLDNLRAEDSRNDPLFRRVRDLSRAFQHALDAIFFDNPEIAPLTREYGLF